MAKECIEYKLHRNDKGNLTTPSWMSDGGYYQAADKTMVGFVPVQAERDWYVPDSVSMLTEQEFVTRGIAMHTASAFQKMDADGVTMKAMTKAEAEKSLRDFYKSKVA